MGFKVLNVVGARPNYMKVAPLYEAMKGQPGFEPTIVHTGQHYDAAMSELFFQQLGLPEPDYYLGVGSGAHGAQTAKIMLGFEEVAGALKPDCVVVVGDVNSTIACGLVAAKSGVRLVHVEAGLRSFDRRMPEEVNRVLTDQISDYLFTTEPAARENLLREGIDEARIHFVGNVMIDTLMKHRRKAAVRPVLKKLGVMRGRYALVTLHRPSNVDEPEMLEQLLTALGALSEEVPVVFPVHPRTLARVEAFELSGLLAGRDGLLVLEPLGYLDFLQCMAHAQLVITDSGGIQEETTVLGVPCITVRENTERPVTVSEGTNVLVGRDPERLVREARRVLAGEAKAGRLPALWDGKAAERIVQVLSEAEGIGTAWRDAAGGAL